MKKAIYTIMIGNNPMYDYTYKAMQLYADKIGADLIKCTKKNINNKKGKVNKKTACDEKLYIKDLLKEYDRLLYLDADILVTPHAPDIFQAYPKLDTVYMFDEGDLDRTRPVQEILSTFPCNTQWPIKQGRPVYYNAGVVLCSKESNIFEFAQLSDLQKIYKSVKMYEQTYFNYLLVKHQQRSESIDLKYNQMCELSTPEDRFDAYFIHYAGKGFSKSSKRRTYTIIQDYFKFYVDDDPLLIRCKKRLKYLQFAAEGKTTDFYKWLKKTIIKKTRNG